MAARVSSTRSKARASPGAMRASRARSAREIAAVPLERDGLDQRERPLAQPDRHVDHSPRRVERRGRPELRRLEVALRAVPVDDRLHRPRPRRPRRRTRSPRAPAAARAADGSRGWRGAAPAPASASSAAGGSPSARSCSKSRARSQASSWTSDALEADLAEPVAARPRGRGPPPGPPRRAGPPPPRPAPPRSRGSGRSPGGGRPPRRARGRPPAGPPRARAAARARLAPKAAFPRNTKATRGPAVTGNTTSARPSRTFTSGAPTRARRYPAAYSPARRARWSAASASSSSTAPGRVRSRDRSAGPTAPASPPRRSVGDARGRPGAHLQAGGHRRLAGGRGLHPRLAPAAPGQRGADARGGGLEVLVVERLPLGEARGGAEGRRVEHVGVVDPEREPLEAAHRERLHREPHPRAARPPAGAPARRARSRSGSGRSGTAAGRCGAGRARRAARRARWRGASRAAAGSSPAGSWSSTEADAGRGRHGRHGGATAGATEGASPGAGAPRAGPAAATARATTRRTSATREQSFGISARRSIPTGSSGPRRGRPWARRGCRCPTGTARRCARPAGARPARCGRERRPAAPGSAAAAGRAGCRDSNSARGSTCPVCSE